jgi:hypothetical protein
LFGGARPREEVLKEKGVDPAKEIETKEDEKKVDEAAEGIEKLSVGTIASVFFIFSPSLYF